MSGTDVRAPEVTVLGLYSPSMSIALYEKFVQAYVDGCDPRNFEEATVVLFKRLGRDAELVPLTEGERSQARDRITHNLGNAAFVEVLIRNADHDFDPADFGQPDSSLDAGHAQVAWNETYLTEDGETVIAGYPMPAVPEGSTLRVVFVIHFWKHGLPLLSSYGQLSCPQMQALPERLWRLAPYEMPD